MIKDLVDGKSAVGTYLIKNVTKGVTQQDLSYLNVTLQDKSGTIEAKKWTVTNEDLETFKNENIIEITSGLANLYKDKLQIKIISAKISNDQQSIIESLLVDPPVPYETLLEKYKFYRSFVKEENLKKILDYLFDKYEAQFLSFPAAVTNHHDFNHGLLCHSVSMCDVAYKIADQYPINKELLIAGCLVHDIGKVIEFNGPISTHYTIEGNLIGHISIGASLIFEAGEKTGADRETTMLLQHMVLSHHGKHEFGSPILPETREALMLSMIDELDSKMSALDKAFKDVQPGNLTDRVFAMENRKFYKPNK